MSSWIRYWWRVARRTLSIWLDINAFAQAASLAFFTLFSIAPVVIVIVSIIGFFFGEQAAEGQIVGQLERTIGAEPAAVVESAVARSRLEGGGLWATIAGVAAMLVGATAVFGQMQSALNAVWEVAPKPSRNSLFLLARKRLASLSIVLAIGLIMLGSLGLSVALNATVRFATDWLPLPAVALKGMDWTLSLLVISSLFAIIYRALPDVQLGWRDVLPGALLTALLFSLGRILIALYLTHTATASTFGAAASVVLLLLWVNYSSLILLFGAAWTRAQLEARGKPIRPRSVAVRVRRELLNEDPDA
ncbi:MAG: YihY/virulence factor BrkB family protein [Pseudomonadota bacterium]